MKNLSAPVSSKLFIISSIMLIFDYRKRRNSWKLTASLVCSWYDINHSHLGEIGRVCSVWRTFQQLILFILGGNVRLCRLKIQRGKSSTICVQVNSKRSTTILSNATAYQEFNVSKENFNRSIPTLIVDTTWTFWLCFSGQPLSIFDRLSSLKSWKSLSLFK